MADRARLPRHGPGRRDGRPGAGERGRPARARRPDAAVHAAGVLGGRLPLRPQHDPRRLRLEPQLRRPRHHPPAAGDAGAALPVHRHRRLHGGGATTLPDNWPAEWDRFVELDARSSRSGRARPIDTFLAGPLADMVNQLAGTTEVPPDSDLGKLLKHLARRNLLRGFRLSLPTGQAVAEALGIPPLTAQELTDGLDQVVRDALGQGRVRRADAAVVLRPARVRGPQRAATPSVPSAAGSSPRRSSASSGAIRGRT